MAKRSAKICNFVQADGLVLQHKTRPLWRPCAVWQGWCNIAYYIHTARLPRLQIADRHDRPLSVCPSLYPRKFYEIETLAKGYRRFVLLSKVLDQSEIAVSWGFLQGREQLEVTHAVTLRLWSCMHLLLKVFRAHMQNFAAIC